MAENPQEMAREILPVNIEDELKQSYMDYAMSVIVGRAYPTSVMVSNRSTAGLVRHERAE